MDKCEILICVSVCQGCYCEVQSELLPKHVPLFQEHVALLQHIGSQIFNLKLLYQWFNLYMYKQTVSIELEDKTNTNNVHVCVLYSERKLKETLNLI